MKKIFLSFAAILAGTFFLGAQQMPQLPNDPAVRKGQLDNGLTYYIRHNEKPQGRAEFYLATNVGAIQETPDQDGLAHFLEHMCFNGTKNFPEKGILDWLQSIGASFGGNVNASTGVEQTQYMLNNIPLVRQSVIDTCLLILHDYSHFVTNEPAEIDKERGVIVEERRSRRNAAWRLHERSLPYYYGDKKYGSCTLIGSQENLLNFKPESLVNFYQTWYHPAMQAVVVVGDVDVDYVEAKLAEIFADIPAKENPQAKEVITIPDNEKPLVGILTDPEQTSVNWEVLWKSEAMPEEYNSTAVGLMQDLLKGIVSQVMAERFGDITAKADAPYLAADLAIGNLCETMEVVMGNVVAREGEALPALAAYLTEIEKMKRFGFSEDEVTRAKENIRAGYETAANQAETRSNAEFVPELISNFFDNTPYMVPQQEYELAQAVLQQINAQVMNQVTAELITPENTVVLCSSGSGKELTPEEWNEIPHFEGLAARVETGSDRPQFVIDKLNIANNVDEDDSNPMGISLFANSIDVLAKIDIEYDSYANEFTMGRKRIFVAPEMLTDANGDQVFDPDDSVFYQLPEDYFKDTKEAMHEVNMSLRVQEHEDAINNDLNLLSFKCGFGTQYYRFEKGTVATATQVISENSDMYRTICKHEIILEDVLKDLIRCIIRLGQTANVPDLVLETDITIDFDDSIIEDKQTERQEDRQDVAMGVMSPEEYRAKWYGETVEIAASKIPDQSGGILM